LQLDPEFNVAYSQVDSQLKDWSAQLEEPNFGELNKLGEGNSYGVYLDPGLGELHNPSEESPYDFSIHLGAPFNLPDPGPESHGMTSGPYVNIYGGDNTGVEAGWVFRFDGP
jgi:hypothetical protein